MARKPASRSFFKHWSQASGKERLVQVGVIVGGSIVCLVLLLVLYVLAFLLPNLPPIDALTEYQPKMPLRVYTADEKLITEFGEERRDFVPIAQIPKVMKQAVIATEDNNFYEHNGVDFTGVARAALANLRRSRSQGASTITMQVARTFLLTRKKTYSRKLQEVMLAYKIESNLSKDQILGLYMNQIYLGERAYGFGSAARIYYGKSIQDVSAAEAAMLAGLPKAPATNNPVVNPKRAIERQQYILQRMHTLGYLDDKQYQRAAAEKVKVQSASQRYPTHAGHAAEMVRQFLHGQYGDEIYSSGFKVYTTLRHRDQNAAVSALRRGVLDYESRHGYRGPEATMDLPSDRQARDEAIDATLVRHRNSGDLQSAVVLSASPKEVRAALIGGVQISISGTGLRFAAPALSAKAKAPKKIEAGAVIRVMREGKKSWRITQLPEVAAAFVALDAKDGAIRALVGGFDFALNQFDHVGQAWRQPGSAFKPFVYSAALDKGFSPSTLVNDAPLTDDSEVTSRGWNPGNDNGRYDGPVTLRTGLKRSKNLVSIRMLRAIGPSYAQEFVTRFGFDADKHPANLTMSLGSGSVTPLQLAGGYAVFANGGYQVLPYLVDKVVDGQGRVLFQASPQTAGDEDSRVLDARNAYIMDSMLKEVVRSGTGNAAQRQLGRSDLAGKTGTTNDAVDGWFAGYGGGVVGVAWMGYDTPRSLGSREFGGTLALPIWIDYMRTALNGRLAVEQTMPAGIAQLNGDYIYQEYVNSPAAVREVDIRRAPPPPESDGSLLERLFGIVPQAPTQNEEERRRDREMYGG